ncbi:dolichyl-diphosphooligosaccharide--protein glycosyltransferase subunit 4 [Aspergillus aculeatinus CBS 121060]|uniref:Dolichyl-diphosphooligosaccharide--protein glycosyltransferase subunit 4 n=3 Tax=Aspergillus TaxID=5052 RepID=A0A8G1RJQ6_9EURO|nr:hypothetical protein BO95DRAFT_443818 [Aspergillus brunneoviolaceus CBS 621.78]XP_025506903.1 hypothetical protein BO66DRAFT_389196 [Aspergillus aculeatinus CBS 121060]XP_040797702.1 uncharacterized protein BO72DRAFT_451528 [Aspergillus fijiensis CBS 313.89]RAH44858.1 hypothetical protein BO95DRAFT_443818 [Aspergillus brunneoviolaceus CBS 621.78]RAH73080.1 hypothetical protein BO66DRAFT_389196 [Aspergillus aculeatinus CBS 121060]RAK73692.1 hypothetical protein BO72DRAFT_451528 [Aspergillus 
MITDDELHRLAVFLGSCAMMMIVLYHFLEVNAKDDGAELDAPADQKVPGVSQETAAAAAAVGSSS